jgi:uncharacterized protein (DUF58 family)
MAATALRRPDLPRGPELQAFARAAARLLTEQRPRAIGARVVRRRAGIGIQHLDHREYVAGDEVRHIDWRQTARRRRPIVRRFESESVSEWTILLDASSSMTVRGAAKWHAALRAAAAMSYALLELGHHVGLLAFGSGVIAQCPKGRGQPHYTAVVRVLGSLQPATSSERSDLGACAARLHEAASVFVISDFLAEDAMCQQLSGLLQRCAALHALQVTDPNETSLPFLGEVDLLDVETGTRIPTLVDESVIAAVKEQRTALTRRLQTFCTRAGIAFTDWEVGKPWQATLLRHLVEARCIC